MVDVRTRTNSEVVDAAFEVYRRHFPVFFTVAVIAFLPSILLSLFVPSAENPGITPSFFLILFVVSVLSYLTTSLGIGAIIIAASNAYLGSGQVDVATAIKGALQRPWTLIWAYFLKVLYISVGFILLIVPGLFALKNYFAVPATVVLEGLSASRGMARSKELSRGHGKRIFLVLGLTWLFYGFVILIMSGVTKFLDKGAFIGGILTLIVYGALYPLVEIVTTILYYDIRVRSEGYDIELMTKELDAELAS